MKVYKRVLFVLALPFCICVVIPAQRLSRPQAAALSLKFEVASVKPSLEGTQSSAGCNGVDLSRTSIPVGRCIFRHTDLRRLIGQAYPHIASLRLEELIVGPDWIDGVHFDVEAKAEDPSTTTTLQLRQMLQTLLNERFKLAFHMETRLFSGYYMVPAKEGFKLKESNGPLTPEEYRAATRNFAVRPFFANNMTMTDFADLLSTVIVRAPVVNKTGIPGKYNIFMSSAETGDEIAGSIFSALQEQLGLKLEAQKIPFDIFVIDHVEKPSDGNR